MERKETKVVEVPPERKQAAMRREQEFGWTLVSAQEEAQMSGGQTRKLAKLLFTRTASAEWVEDMNHLQKELETHDTSVTFGGDKLVILPEKPTINLPIPILIVIMFAGYLVGWFIYDIPGGVILGPLSALISWLLYKHQGKKKLQKHTQKRQKATEAFKKKRHEILVRVRAHANTRESSL